jgi:tetratricopeptide (TPR) repeat protein
LAVIEIAEAAYLAAEYDLALTKAQTVFNIVPAAQGYSLGKALWIAARSQNELGNLTEAVALAEQSVKAYPELDIFWLTLSDLYLKQHNWSQASTSAQNAIDNASSSAWSYFNLGRASLHSGDIQSARQAYEDAFAKLPEDAAQEVEASIAELEEDRVQYPELTQEINGLIAFLHTK